MTINEETDPGLPVFCTVRPMVEADGDNMLSIECRFADGQKYAAVLVEECCDQLAHFIADAINAKRSAVEQAPTK